MQSTRHPPDSVEGPASDLGPLAWVFDELRKSLDAANKALKRFSADTADARGSDLSAVDPSTLRVARSQLHQVVGALDMVGFHAPALVVGGMEAAVQRFLNRPASCTEVAIAKIEKAGFALVEYLEAVLNGKTVSSVALFVQYRDVKELAGVQKIHPSDLWDIPLNAGRVVTAAPALTGLGLQAGSSGVGALFDRYVLHVIKSQHALAATHLKDICAGMAAGCTVSDQRSFWQQAAAFMEAIQHGLLPNDLYVKRTASRLLSQYSAHSHGNPDVSSELRKEVLFFVAHAMEKEGVQTPWMDAVRQATGLGMVLVVDYGKATLGRFDPALLLQARKRVSAAKEGWTLLTGGDTSKTRQVLDQFSLVADSLHKILPHAGELGQSLVKAAASTHEVVAVPNTELGMEVATAVLYLEAVMQDMEPGDETLADRMHQMAARVDGALTGRPSLPLEAWMEDLYRRVSDRHTMGSVVGELKISLSELERELDQFSREPGAKSILIKVPQQLAQMKGVLSVLGLDHAAQAVAHMRTSVEGMLVDEVDAERARAAGTFGHLANNLSALSFLIDMLNYQPALAKKLFVFDPDQGELKPLMGRVQSPTAENAQPIGASSASAVVAPSVKAVSFDATIPISPARFVATVVIPPPKTATVVPPQGGASESSSSSELLPLLPLDQPAPAQAFDQTVVLSRPQASETAEAPAPFPLGFAEPVLAPVPTPPPAPPVPAPARVTAAAPVAPALSEEDEELRGIFLDEAREVIEAGLAAIDALSHEPGSMPHMTTLRRAFHTLKGSSRMVGLNEFGEAAWGLEQMMNAWLAESKPTTAGLRTVSKDAMSLFAAWVDDIAGNQDAKWRSGPFTASAEAMRHSGHVLPIALPAPDLIAEEPPTEAIEEPAMVAVPDTVSFSTIVPEAPPLSATPTVVESSELATAPETPLVGVAEPLPDVLPPLAQTEELTAPEPVADVAAIAESVSLVMPPEVPLEAAALADGLVAMPSPAVEAPEPDINWDFGFEVESVDAVEAPAVDALAVTEDADFSLDFDLQPEPAQVVAEIETPPAQLQEAEEFFADLLPEAEPVSEAATSFAEQVVVDEFELSVPVAEADWPQAGSASETEAEAIPAAEVEAMDDAVLSLSAPVPSDVVALDEPVPDAVESANASDSGFALMDDGIKVIGTVRIGRKLFGVYLSEADEWSRRLNQSLGDWQPDCQVSPVPESAAAMAHSLAGASAAVGFTDLSGLARSLEHALDAAHAHAQEGRMVNADHAALFVSAAEDVRRMLHQFAAGFLKEPSFDIMDALHDFVHQPSSQPDEVVLHVQGDADVLSALPDLIAEDSAAIAAAGVPAQPPEVAPDHDSGAVHVEEAAPVQADWVPAAEEEVSALSTVTPLIAPEVKPSESVPATTFVQAPSKAASVDDDIDAVDTLDADLFQIFEEEAQELFPRLGTSLRQWVRSPEDASARVDVLRCLHTVKGSARLAGALRLGEMAHRMETQAERLGSDVSVSALVEPLLTSFDALVGRFEELRLPGHMAVANRVSTAAEQAPVITIAEAVLAPVSAEASVVQTAPAAVQVNAEASGSSVVTLQPMSHVLAATRLPIPVIKTTTAAAVRVRPELLDRLVNQTGEVMISRSRMDAEIGQLRGSLADLASNLERLRYQLRDIELQAESQMQTRLAQAKDTDHTFDPLEFDRFTRVQELTRMMAESVSDVATVQRNLQRSVDATEDGLAAQARQTRELQRDLLRTRMVEFEGISDRLYRVVRQASKETGKQVRLDIMGGSIEMDRAVLDRMTPAFEHLLRNCVGHGIESPAERTQAGKSPEGNITIHLAQEGNEVSVVFADDGRGLNLEKIRQKALSIGLIEASSLPSDTELAQLIFAPGLTTATEVTGLSGRGIGMDVVRSEVAGLGGRVETTTEASKGTRFRMVLPLTTAVTQVVMVRAGDFALGAPSGLVELVRRVNATELAAAYESGHLMVGGESVPFYWVGALLQMSRRSDQTEGRTFPVVIFRSASQRVALHVDEVLGNQEVVVKNLGPQLSRLPGLAAMTVLASGAVALIYNPVALAAVYGNQVQAWLAQGQPQTVVAADGAVADPGMPVQPVVPEPVPAVVAHQLPLVLVVDDSITVRRVTQRLLVREGFRVTLAADGLQALEKLQDERPAVVLSDIEMPRMDGFDLVRNIRADVRLADLPVIMITSRIAEKHREHARQLGVDHYLGKPYAEDVLLGLLRDYCRNELVSA